MKTKFHFFVIMAVALAFTVSKANAQVLVQYWDFNATPPAGGGGGDSLGNSAHPLKANRVAAGLTDTGHITYSRPTAHYNATVRDSILDNGSQGSAIFDFSNTNDTGGTAAGNLFLRTRNPSDSCVMITYIPTTGYKNIKLEFAISASSTKGANYGIFSYTTDNVTWKKLTKTMDTFNIGGVYRPDTLQLQNPVTSASNWYPVVIDFSSDAGVNSNALFAVRMMLAGPNTHQQTGGNARFDNFAVWGTAISQGVNEISAQEAGYNVYPNPAGDFANVISRYAGDKVITLYNVVGQVVSVSENKDLTTTINTSSLNTGIYFVEIKEVSTGNKYTVKLVKE